MVHIHIQAFSLLPSLTMPGIRKSADEQSTSMASSKLLKVSASPQHMQIGILCLQTSTSA